METNRLNPWIGSLVAVLLLLGTWSVQAGDKAAGEAEREMEFGYQAARRGYWQEALMRFQHADKLTPNQARILNNMAVALEANGRYEEALVVYETGLTIAPHNDALRRNYARYKEFYDTYLAPPEEAEEAEAEEEAGNAS